MRAMKLLPFILFSSILLGCSENETSVSTFTQEEKDSQATPANQSEQKNLVAYTDQSKHVRHNFSKGARANLSEVYNFLQAETQVFSFDAKEDTEITCARGTKIILKSNSLVFTDGSAVSGRVDLSVKECYDLSEFIAEGLSTRAGDELLETGGMVHLTATSDGKEVLIKEGSGYEIQIPKNGEDKKDMTLFYGNDPVDGIIDWTLAPAAPAFGQSSYSALGRAPSNAFIGSPQGITNDARTITKTKKIEPSIECSMRRGIYVPTGQTMTTLKLADTNATAMSYFNDNFVAPKEMIHDFYMKHYTPIYDLTFDNKGKLSRFKVIDGASRDYDQLIANFFNELPPVDLEELNSSKVQNFHHLCFARKKGTTYSAEYLLDDLNEQYKAYENEVVEVIDTEDLKFYTLSATGFGWINCDRFYKKNVPKVDYVVKVADPLNTSVQLVFTDIKNCMHSTYKNGQFTFAGIPVGQEIKLIAIYNNGIKAGLCIERTTVQEAPIRLNDFSTFTLSELRDELNSI
ncbi:MAG: hypothetical protein ACI837_003052 [Crocinitomicaceae bacterium]|jgi:hypothetical protein